jgi:penicillin G amidase
MGRFFLNFAFSLSLLCTSAAVIAEQPNPLTVDSTYKVAGLSLPAEIIVDEWGVPHIYANDHYDVFFVQGFNAARDRLWQIDTWRRRGLGQLSEVFGADYVAQDKAARMFLYRKDMYSEWLAYGNDAKRITESFVAGINAFVKVAQQNPDLMPPEFALLGYAPSIWQPEDVVRIRSNGLWRNVVTEVWRARLACKDQLKEAAQWKVLEPSWEAKVPKGLDPCVIPDDVLDNYLLAKAPVKFQANPKQQTLAQAVVDAHRLDVGSNNWVVAGDRTTTGRPILADDPHRGHAVPSLRYIAHLNGPGIDVIGAGEPALPGISIGHNKRIAFGLTIFPIDQEDLYVYRKAKNGYRYQNGVEPFTKVTEVIKVKGAPSKSVELLFSRHGPIVNQTKKHAFAVRAAWLEPGMSPYFGSIEYMRAQNFREFVGALNRWGAPSENQVYADADGNIGYKPAGRFPKRDNWDGLLPVPGDGSYEWDGYFDMDVLPEEYNPERGFSGTANAMSLPDNYPIETYKVGFEWSAPWRYRRLWEVLEADDEHSMKDSLALQRDYESVFARSVLAQVPVLLSRKAAQSQLLAGWDHKLTTDSPAAALWNVWYYRHLGPALGETLSKDPGAASPRIDTQTVLELLKTEKGQSIASNTLAAAWNETKDLLGDEPSDWQWGDLHKIKFSHPLLAMATGELKTQMAIPEYPRGGSENTTNNTGYNPDNFLVRSGASFRMVVDVGNWDEAKMTNAPGQSGNPGSPYYDNLLKNWATDSHLPMVYSKARVEAHKAFTITLEPAE